MSQSVAMWTKGEWHQFKLLTVLRHCSARDHFFRVLLVVFWIIHIKVLTVDPSYRSHTAYDTPLIIAGKSPMESPKTASVPASPGPSPSHSASSGKLQYTIPTVLILLISSASLLTYELSDTLILLLTLQSEWDRRSLARIWASFVEALGGQ